MNTGDVSFLLVSFAGIGCIGYAHDARACPFLWRYGTFKKCPWNYHAEFHHHCADQSPMDPHTYG